MAKPLNFGDNWSHLVLAESGCQEPHGYLEINCRKISYHGIRPLCQLLFAGSRYFEMLPIFISQPSQKKTPPNQLQLTPNQLQLFPSRFCRTSQPSHVCFFSHVPKFFQKKQPSLTACHGMTKAECLRDVECADTSRCFFLHLFLRCKNSQKLNVFVLWGFFCVSSFHFVPTWLQSRLWHVVARFFRQQPVSYHCGPKCGWK